MFWTPPKVKMTPKLKNNYKILEYLNKKITTPRGSYIIDERVENEIQKVAKSISEERRGILELERCVEPLCLEMGNSIAATLTKNQEYEHQ